MENNHEKWLDDSDSDDSDSDGSDSDDSDSDDSDSLRPNCFERNLLH
jgi:hypothetical protein